jgi:hypothetical protein
MLLLMKVFIKSDLFERPEMEGISPVAVGDGPRWIEGNPDVSQFSLYGSAHVGIFGSIIQKTNVDKILKLDCLATDFYRDEAYPTYLIFNPYDDRKEVDYYYQGPAVYLYDVIHSEVLAENVTGTTKIMLPGRKSRLIVEIPQDKKLEKQYGVWMAGEVVVAYQ